MPQSSRFQARKGWAALLGISLILMGFVGFLLFANYRSLMKLQAAALNQYKHEFNSRGLSLANFLDINGRRIKCGAAEKSQLPLYFENKALGMSLRYGLGFNLTALTVELNELVDKVRFDGEPVFKGVAIYDTRGAMVAQSDGAAPVLPDDPLWPKSLLQLPEGFYACQIRDREPGTPPSVFFMAFPYHYKGRYAAHGIAVFSTALLRSRFLVPVQGGLFTGLFAPSGHLIGSGDGAAAPFPPANGQILFPDHLYPRWLSAFKASEEVLALSCNVGDTRLELREIASLTKIIGTQSPQQLLLAMILVFAVLLGAAIVIMAVFTRNLVLKAQVREAARREKDIALKNEQLQAQMAESKRLEAARIKLEAHIQRGKKMEAIGLLAGGVAHDLNNILTSIVSYPDLLLMQVPEDSSLKEPLLTIKESGQKAAAVVRDLLTLARRGVVANEVLHLNTIIKSYLQSPEHLKLLTYHDNVRVKTDLEQGPFNIMGSPVHLSKTIMNLVTNAAEAMPGGGTVTISTKSFYIGEPLGNTDKIEAGEYIRLSVADTGTGMAPEECEKIFEPFYTRKIMGRSGTGLGMSVVWGTVKDHNGYIDVTTALGKGTRFDLYFPVTRKTADTGSHAVLSIESCRGNGQAILVVDDLKEQRDIALTILTTLGYNPVAVESGEKAVEVLKTRSVDLVVLDMIMEPGIDGLETYKRIIALHPGQKAVIASGYSKTRRIQKAMALGVRRFIKKPYSFETIALSVKAALEE